eukprot:CAMPEP_0114515680 /NCGR_PEP_ID=MMETSP0109-20121206/16880_1 /TAXON_ID=29199 /ORGANISM="Chlorarachnion reptans, Strain CCCM449" /LENGTH=115 /DNA_ID=CAMNT_0001695931 /DNA_START=75 /DNA_END=419 /DNA_ORIENTATION=-
MAESPDVSHYASTVEASSNEASRLDHPEDDLKGSSLRTPTRKNEFPPIGRERCRSKTFALLNKKEVLKHKQEEAFEVHTANMECLTLFEFACKLQAGVVKKTKKQIFVAKKAVTW